MDKSKFPPKASTKNVQKKRKSLIKSKIVLDKSLHMNHRSTEANFSRWSKNLTRRSGVGWGGVDGAGWNEVKWDGVEERKLECIRTECGTLV